MEDISFKPDKNRRAVELQSIERTVDAKPSILESRDKSKRDKRIVLVHFKVFGLDFLLFCKVLENPPVSS